MQGVSSTNSTPTSSTRSCATIRDTAKTTTGTATKLTARTVLRNRTSRSASPIRANGIPRNVA